jgi:superfamily II DNA/RNA helicase
MNFKDLNLHPEILKALEAAGLVTPTPIQEQAIPQVLAGIDIKASAQTGTGKTAAFLLPILHLLSSPSKLQGKGPRALILAPTRELAMQIQAETLKFAKFLPKMKPVCIFGGAPYPVQNRELSGRYEILIATPGRLIDHIERGRIDFSRIEFFVLDEADRMLDMGFIEPVEHIAEMLPKEHQTLLFSATLKGTVLRLAERLLRNPIEIKVNQDHEKHESIEQRLYNVDNLDHKYALLYNLLEDPTINQAIVFTATKRHADELVDKLFEQGHQSAALHGDMNQGQRTRTIGLMRRGQIRVLVATDVAARGIDVQTITHVINFDLPNNAEDYVHRIGRTGRAGSLGIALSFAAPREFGLVKDIERFTGQKIAAHFVAGLEPKIKEQRSSPSQAPRRPYRGPARQGSGRPSSSGSRAPNSARYGR